MKKKEITMREILTPEDIARYWEAQDEMARRDVFPHTDIGEPPTEEEQQWFLGDGFHSNMEQLCAREVDRCYRFFFYEGEREVGFVVLCIYGSEDGRCFILNYCVYPEERCRGVGSRCFAALCAWAEARGTRYYELNTHSHRSLRFWKRQGFRYNGFDEYGTILVCKPPQELGQVACALLPRETTEEMRRQLCKLENGFMSDVGEDGMDSDRWERLIAAVEAEQIRFFVAWRGCRAIGMCSLSLGFSTYACRQTASFDDFFVEPVFRKQGIAQLLVRTARAWAKERGLACMTVGCAHEDVKRYRALGFDTTLGTLLADHFET